MEENKIENVKPTVWFQQIRSPHSTTLLGLSEFSVEIDNRELNPLVSVDNAVLLWDKRLLELEKVKRVLTI